MNRKIVYLLLLLFLLTSCNPIRDNNLKRKISKEASMNNIKIEEIESLDCSNLNIQNLNGISQLKSLKRLNLSNNEIKDISELSNLTNLTSLDLQNNQINDLSSLVNIPNLKSLYIRNNPIEDFSFINDIARNIKESDFILNGVFDSALEEIIKAEVGNIITEFNILSIKELDLLSTDVKSLKYLDEFENLEILKADSVVNIESVGNILGLRELYITNSNVEDINFLSNLKKLKTLDLSNNNISDITILGELTKLQYINLKSNNISDISSLKNLDLKEIYLKSNPIEEYSIIDKVLENAYKTDVYIAYFNDENLNNAILENLKINNAYISINKLNKLKRLDLSNKDIKNIGGIENLKSLIELDLSFNDIEDISYLKELKNLKILRLNNNNISNISFLAYIKNINLLDLSFNNIDSVESLLYLPNLKYLYLKGNNIDDNSIKEELKNKLEITDEW